MEYQVLINGSNAQFLAKVDEKCKKHDYHELNLLEAEIMTANIEQRFEDLEFKKYS